LHSCQASKRPCGSFSWVSRRIHLLVGSGTDPHPFSCTQTRAVPLYIVGTSTTNSRTHNLKCEIESTALASSDQTG
jgi:hypothetical protein